MAVPDAFGFGPKCQMDFPVQSFSHFKLVSGIVCVSVGKLYRLLYFLIVGRDLIFYCHFAVHLCLELVDVFVYCPVLCASLLYVLMWLDV